MKLSSVAMGLVPLGISVQSWTKSIDPKSQQRSDSGQNGMFMDDRGKNSFHRVISPHGATGKGSLSDKLSQKVVSPLSQILEQTKEKERLKVAPDNSDVSLNYAATSTSGKGGKGKKAGKSSATKKKKRKPSKPTSGKSGAQSTIKRLQKKRNSQSTSKRGTVKKKPSTRKGGVKTS